MKRIIALLVAIYLGSFIISAPATYLYALIKGEIAPNQINAIEGTVWNGSGELQIPGIKSADIQWRFMPLSMLTAGLGWHLSTEDKSIEGSITSKWWSLDKASKITLETTTGALANWNPLLSTITSEISANLKNIKAGSCDATSGLVSLAHTDIMGLPFGTIHAEISCKGENYSAVITNADSPIAVAGQAILTPNGSYQFTAKLQSAAPAIRQQLSALLGGSPENRTFTVRQNGTL